MPQTTAARLQERLIEGVFTTPQVTIIQTLLNNAYEKNDFETLTQNIQRLEQFGDQINKRLIISKVLKSIRAKSKDAFDHNGKIIRAYPALIPQDFVSNARQQFINVEQLILKGSVAMNLLSGLVDYYELALGKTLTPVDIFKFGIICSKDPSIHGKSAQFFEKYLKLTEGVTLTDEKIMAAYALNYFQKKNLVTDYIAQLQMNRNNAPEHIRNNINTYLQWHVEFPSTLAAWTRKIFDTFQNYNFDIANYAWGYVLKHATKSWTFDDYLRRDYLTFKGNGYKDVDLRIKSEKLKSYLATTEARMRRDAGNLSYLNLKDNYLKLVREYSAQAHTKSLGWFALLCLGDFYPDDMDALLHIHEYHLKYMTDNRLLFLKDENERDVLYKSLHELYYKRERYKLNTAEDNYRLARIAYKTGYNRLIWNRRILLGVKDCHAFENSEITKLLKHSIQYLIKASEQNPTSSRMADIYSYLSLAHSQLNDLEKANEYLEMAVYWRDDYQPTKIRKLRKTIARAAFYAPVGQKDYAQALAQFAQIGTHPDTDDQEELVLKILCLNKMGYKAAVNQERVRLTQFRSTSNVWDIELYGALNGEGDFDSVSLLYEMIGSGNVFRGKILKMYCAAEMSRKNYSICRQLSESYIETDPSCDLMGKFNMYPGLILADIACNEWDKFLLHLTDFIQSAEEGFINSDQDLREQSRAFLTHFFFQSQKSKDQYILKIIEKVNGSLVILPPEVHICSAYICSSLNEHNLALDYLLKAVSFENDTMRVLKRDGVTSDDLEKAHTTLKEYNLNFCNTFFNLNKINYVNNFRKYLNDKHKIGSVLMEISDTKRGRKNNKNRSRNNTDMSGFQQNIHQQLMESYVRRSKESFATMKQFIEELYSITPAEWQQMSNINSAQLLSTAQQTINLMQERFAFIDELAKHNDGSAQITESTRKAHQELLDAAKQLSALTSKVVYQVKVDRKKKMAREHFEKNHQVNEESLLRPQNRKNKEEQRVALRLQQLHEQEKERLVQERQRLRQIQRQKLQQGYAAEHTDEQVDSTIAPETLLITCSVLPATQDAYKDQHHMLLWKLLTHKFNLNPEDQETLRVILTGGERSFQITLNDIKSLFGKFQGYTSNVHHGGSHEQVAGMGLTLMPNADGVKKGSYKGQINQAREKIISIIAKTLTYKDLDDAS